MTIQDRTVFGEGGRKELKLLIVCGRLDVDIRECVRKIDGSGENPVVHFDKGGVLVADEIFKLGFGRFENWIGIRVSV
jgi:hypothetical protein